MQRRNSSRSRIQKSLLLQFEKLDHESRQIFNQRFLEKLAENNSDLQELLSQHVSKREGKKAIAQIFPNSKPVEKESKKEVKK